MTTLLTPERTQPVVEHVALPELELGPDSFVARHIRKMLAASGFVMLGYVVAHMAGNLLAFGGPAVFNGYAHGLRELGAPSIPESGLLWLVRVMLSAALALHLVSHMYIMLHPTIPSPLAESEVMPPWYATLPLGVLQVSGTLIAVFVGYHLAQLTFGGVHPAFIPGDAYQNTIVALRFWPVSLAYIGAAVAVGLHLLPGLWTAARSLGLIRPKTASFANRLSPAIAAGVAFGMSAVPVAVLTGILR
jgi:succinate dehydrogenase / fumarate reductase cytochrome b subunit